MYQSDKLKNRGRQVVVLFLTLMLFWVILVDTLAPDSLLAGAMVSLGIALLYRNGLPFFTELRPTPRALLAGLLSYGYFFRELVRSNFRLAAIVL